MLNNAEILMKYHFTTKKDNDDISQIVMGGLAILVGLIAGFGAIFFRDLIGFIHNLFFLGKFSFIYDANIHTALSPWGLWIIFIPVIGALVVVWLVKNFAPEAKGHGVPEVMYAIYMQEGKIRPIVAVIKSLASAISIGTGGSVGREGPIVQIGSTFGSFLGTIINMPVRQRNILIAAGAAGGIAATFNTPVGALAFAIELMLTSISASSLFVVIVATVTATYIGRAFLGVTPSFYIQALTIPNFNLIPASALAVFLPFGILIGLCSALFIHGLYWFEDRFDALTENWYLRHIIGMFCVGVMMYLMIRFAGHYYIEGVGYATIVDILRGMLAHPWFLLLLVFVKLLSTFLTLGSGASGGIFSPALFLGATLGGAFGLFLQHLFPGLGIQPIVFAIAGMAGMIGGATGAVLTGITMVTEMTHDNNVVLPILITVGAAYIVRKMISHSSIYTLKLLRRGEVVPEGLQSAVVLAQRAKYMMSKNFKVLTLQELKDNPEVAVVKDAKEIPITIIATEGQVLGVLDSGVVRGKASFKSIEDHIDKHITIVHSKATLPDVFRALKDHNATYALVTPHYRLNKATDVIGVITKKDIVKSGQQTYDLL